MSSAYTQLTHIRHLTGIAALSCTLMLSHFSNALAADNNTEKTAVATASKTAVSSYQTGSLYVDQIGTQGVPIILIPGLSSGAYVWDDLVQRLQKDHVLYVLTLAGFDGKPAMDGPKLSRARDSLLQLITEKKIDRPVLIGHSLGSALAIWFAESHTDKIRGVFGIDGLPVMPRSENLSAEQRQEFASRMQQHYAQQTPEQYAAGQLQYMRNIAMSGNQFTADFAQRSARSDVAATAAYMSELFATDMRPDLPKISVPVTIISPYYAPDFAALNMTEAAKTDYIRSLIPGLKTLKMVSIPDSRHFVMQDQPEVLAARLQEFLSSLR